MLVCETLGLESIISEKLIKKLKIDAKINYVVLDFNELLLLMEKDLERFNAWNAKSEDLSTEELKKGIMKWLIYYRETCEKYKNLKDEDSLRDATLFGAKMAYFHFLGNYTLNALALYTGRLQKEYYSLKKSKKPKAIKARKKNSKI